MKKLAALLLLLPLLSGCAHITEIDSLMIVSGIAVDKKDNEYDLTTQIVKIASSDQNDRSALFINTAGRSLAGALSNIVTQDGEKLFFNHTQIIFISGELLADEGISHLIETLNLEARFRSSVRLAVTETSAADVIRGKALNGDISSFALNQAIDQSSLLIKTPDTPFFCFLNDVLEDGADGILPLVTVKEADGERIPVINGTALFKDDRFVKALSTEQTQFLLLAKNDVESGSLVIGDSVFRIIKSKPKITCSGFNTKITVDASLTLLEGGSKDNDTTRLIAENGIREGLNDLFGILKETGCDPVGIGRRIKRENCELWKSIYPETWKKIYKDLPIEYEISVKIVDPAKMVPEK